MCLDVWCGIVSIVPVVFVCGLCASTLRFPFWSSVFCGLRLPLVQEDDLLGQPGLSLASPLFPFFVGFKGNLKGKEDTNMTPILGLPLVLRFNCEFGHRMYSSIEGNRLWHVPIPQKNSLPRSGQHVDTFCSFSSGEGRLGLERRQRIGRLEISSRA